jgi:hypothetical protein
MQNGKSWLGIGLDTAAAASRLLNLPVATGASRKQRGGMHSITKRSWRRPISYMRSEARMS